MKIFAAALFAALVSAGAQAAFLFSDIPWNTPAQSVIRKLTEAGFKVAKKPDHGDYRFRGTLANHDATGVALMSDGKLVKVVVALSTPAESVRETYDQIRAVLLEKYGPPAKTIRSFLDPFHEGDGYEQEAIRAGKAVFATQWSDSGQGLMVNISPDLNVNVTYQSAAWAAELQRRNKF